MSQCTATIEGADVGLDHAIPCVLDAGHEGAHISAETADGEILWGDSNYGATPHHKPGTPKPATNRQRPTTVLPPTGSQFEDWLTLKARSAGWNTSHANTLKQLTFVARLALAGALEGHNASKLAAGLGVTEQELRDAYTPEKRQRDIAELRADPDLAALERDLDA